MNYLYSKWNLKCQCNWQFTDPYITDINGGPVEGTVIVYLAARCPKHENILKYILRWTDLPTRISVEALRDLEWREKDNKLFPKTNRFDLIFDS